MLNHSQERIQLPRAAPYHGPKNNREWRTPKPYALSFASANAPRNRNRQYTCRRGDGAQLQHWRGAGRGTGRLKLDRLLDARIQAAIPSDVDGVTICFCVTKGGDLAWHFELSPRVSSQLGVCKGGKGRVSGQLQSRGCREYGGSKEGPWPHKRSRIGGRRATGRGLKHTALWWLPWCVAVLGGVWESSGASARAGTVGCGDEGQRTRTIRNPVGGEFAEGSAVLHLDEARSQLLEWGYPAHQGAAASMSALLDRLGLGRQWVERVR